MNNNQHFKIMQKIPMTTSLVHVIVTGFAKTVPIGTTIEIHLWLNIKATLLHYPGTPSTWV